MSRYIRFSVDAECNWYLHDINIFLIEKRYVRFRKKLNIL
jgi:hypothetical protein